MSALYLLLTEVADRAETPACAIRVTDASGSRPAKAWGQAVLGSLARRWNSGRARKNMSPGFLLLDIRSCLLRDESVTVGLADRSQLHPREVLRAAVLANWPRTTLAHCHPSGDFPPSSWDVTVRRELVSAGKMLGIKVLDHVSLRRRTPGQEQDYLSGRETGARGTEDG